MRAPPFFTGDTNQNRFEAHRRGRAVSRAAVDRHPVLVNQDSSITLLAVPFVWLAYAAAFVKFIPPHFKETK